VEGVEKVVEGVEEVDTLVEVVVEEVVVDETVVERLGGETYFGGRVELGFGALEGLGVVYRK